MALFRMLSASIHLKKSSAATFTLFKSARSIFRKTVDLPVVFADSLAFALVSPGSQVYNSVLLK
jgi:hypothetical protein